MLEYSKHRTEFIEWISQDTSPLTYQPYIKYLDEMLAGKVISTPRQLAELISEIEQRRGRKLSKNRINAIRAYLRFLLKRGYYRKSQIIDYYPILETKRSGVRRMEIPTDEVIAEAHKYLKENADISILLAFYLQVHGGLRLIEACDVLNNFHESELTIMDKIARYDLLAMYQRIGSTKARAKATKRAWVAYISPKLAEMLKEYCPLRVSYRSLKGDRYCNGIVTGIQIREWFSSFLARHKVEERIIEFMTGKTPSTILRRHYIDLLRESDETYSQIVGEIEKVLEGRYEHP